MPNPWDKLDRRRFLKHGVQTAAAAAATLKLRPAFAATTGTTPPRNLFPLTPGAFTPLPLGSIRPAGWLRRQLEIQANGLGGHLDETWPDVGPNSGWLGGTGESWERGPYFLDGLVPLAWQLDDARLKQKAQRFLDWTLEHQQANGMIGPASNDDWWPRMVMLKVLTQYEEATGDPRVIPLMERYLRYQLATLPARPLRDWGKFRWQDNALSVLWLYNRTGDPDLLRLVRLLHAQGYDWQRQYADFRYTEPVTPERIKLNENQGLGDTALATHGVNNGQALKAAPLWYLVTGRPADRAGFSQMLGALDRYHGLPNGMFSCDEHFAGRNPSQGSELCTVVEMMFSLEQSFAILGDAAIADRLEMLAFNALPGAFTDDMWAHQYNQEPNQVEVSLHRKPWTTDGPESNLYGLEPNFGCCTANFHQGWPKFTASLWMATPDGGLVAAAYSPCELRTTVQGVPVHITEETEYPFRGIIHLSVEPGTPAAFPLHLRIPAWAASVSVLVNGKPADASRKDGFVTIERTWRAGDRVELTLPMAPRLARGFNNSASILRGPLVFSYPVGTDWVKLRDRGMTADWQVFPAAAWNYALAVQDDNAHALTVRESPVGDVPFSSAQAPVRIEVPAARLDAWRAEDGVANPVPQSPAAGPNAAETLALCPYAGAKLRITAFPTLKQS